MLGVASAHLGPDLRIRPIPEAAQVLRHRQRPPRRRQQLQLDGHAAIDECRGVRQPETLLQLRGEHRRGLRRRPDLGIVDADARPARYLEAFGHQLIEPRRLFTEWESHWPTRLHPRLKARRFTAGKPDWWRDLDPLAHGAQWGGDVAAWHYTQALKPATVTLHLAPDDLDAGLRGLARAGQLRAAADGEVEILQRFWDLDRVPDGPLAPAPLVHAQLVATLDPRALAVAAQLFDSHLADALAQA